MMDMTIINNRRSFFPFIVIVKLSSKEMKSAAANLGVSGVSLFRCLTTRTKLVRGQPVRSSNTPEAVRSHIFVNTCIVCTLNLYYGKHVILI